MGLTVPEASATAADRGVRALAELAERACDAPLPLTCEPPPPDRAVPYGDLVPLGFVLRALDRAAPDPEGAAAAAARRLRRHLGERRQDLLWPFHSGTLVTATDSALVLLGDGDPAGVEALERFSDGAGGYAPQLWTEGEPEVGRMPKQPANAHWCQPDYGTTCLVRALRREAGLPAATPLSRLEAGFSTRGGLYFAHPHLTDWFLAMALRDDPQAAGLRRRLAREILDGAEADGSFGTFETPFATALAILALRELGAGEEELRAARAHLAESAGEDGRWPPSTPFYSSLAEPEGALSAAELLGVAFGRRDDHRVWMGNEAHAVSFYVDREGLVSTAVAVLALAGVADPDPPREAGAGELAPPGEPHPRYRCLRQVDYVADHALPPYAASAAATGTGTHPG